MQINPYGQPDCKICVFSFDDFPQGRCRNIYFWRNMHPGAGGIGWYRAKVLMAQKKNSLGLLGAISLHKYGHDNQKSD